MIDIFMGVGLLICIWLLWWAWPEDFSKPQRRNPFKYMKNRMMREGNLSSRQWRKFRKRMNRDA